MFSVCDSTCTHCPTNTVFSNTACLANNIEFGSRSLNAQCMGNVTVPQIVPAIPTGEEHVRGLRAALVCIHRFFYISSFSHLPDSFSATACVAQAFPSLSGSLSRGALGRFSTSPSCWRLRISARSCRPRREYSHHPRLLFFNRYRFHAGSTRTSTYDYSFRSDLRT